jgi:hypothetical protein
VSSVTAVSLTSLGWAGAFSVREGIALVLAFGATLAAHQGRSPGRHNGRRRDRLDPVAAIERASPSA